MFSQISKSLIVCAAFTLIGCQTTTSSNDEHVNNRLSSNFIISEPLPINFKKEIALARISDVISSEDLTPEQFGQAFYDRGLLYDSFGLPNLARLDFNRALRANPKMADAYNFVGVHYTLIGQFEKAYEAFDATLELAPEHEYVFLNRGLSLFYGGETKLAVQDFKKFHEFDNSDPYRVIWRYLAEYKIDKEMATKNLKENRKGIDNTVWGRQIVDLFLLNISQKQFVDDLIKGVENPTQLAERLCEAYFYLGKFASMYEQPELALDYFKLALATNVFEFIEHRYARRELLEIRLQIHKNAQIKHEIAQDKK